MISYPGINGPNPLYEEGSVELDIAAKVLPQKFPSGKIILAAFFSIPFFS
jgi:hypothetical protein